MTAAESLLRRDRLVVGVCLCFLGLLSWYYLLTGAGTGMSVAAMSTWQFPPPVYPGDADYWPMAYWGLMLAMGWVMMIAMMLPSAAERAETLCAEGECRRLTSEPRRQLAATTPWRW